MEQKQQLPVMDAEVAAMKRNDEATAKKNDTVAAARRDDDESTTKENDTMGSNV